MKFDWAIVLAVGVLVLTSGFILWLALPSPEPGAQTEQYGPWTFTYEAPFWVTQYQIDDQLYDLSFRYLPQEVDDIPVTGSSTRLTAPFYLSFDPNMTNASLSQMQLAFADATIKLTRIYGERPIGACTNNDDPACNDVPLVDCSSGASAIVFYEREDPSVRLNPTCIRIEGTGEDLYRAENLMWYRLLDIVK